MLSPGEPKGACQDCAGWEGRAGYQQARQSGCEDSPVDCQVPKSAMPRVPKRSNEAVGDALRARTEAALRRGGERLGMACLLAEYWRP